MIIYHSRFLTRGEVWYDEAPDETPVDWIVYRGRSRPVPGTRTTMHHTYVLDLTQTPEALLARMERTTRQDLRKARDTDKTVCERLEATSPRIQTDFAAAYARFSARKDLWPLDKAWVARTAEVGALHIWLARSPGGEPLVYDSMVRTRECVRGIHLVTLQCDADAKEDRRKGGCANRLMLWESALYYRQQGVKWFDFGGWYTGTDPAMLSINRFKKGFGGQVVPEYECEQILSVRAWVLLHTARLWLRVRRRKWGVNRQAAPAKAGPASQQAIPV